MESLGSMGVAENPGVFVGTRKPRTPSSVCAQTTEIAAMLASPIHRFRPVRTQSSPSRRANVVIDPGSDPEPGSVRPKQPIASPVLMRGSHSCFCSSDPCLWIADIASDPWTDTKVRSPLSQASSSVAASPYSTAERPAHPYPVRCMPSRPCCANSGTSSTGKCASSYHCAMWGRSRSSTKARIRSRVAFSSSVRSESNEMRAAGSVIGAAVMRAPLPVADDGAAVRAPSPSV